MFELMTRMYADMKAGFAAVDKRFITVENDIKEIKKDVSVLKKDVSVLKEDVSVLKEDVSGLKKDVIRLENTLTPKIDAALDGYKQVYEKQQEHDKEFEIINHKIDDLTMKVTNHEARFEVIEGGKKNTR